MQWKLGEPGTPLLMAVQQGKTEVVDSFYLIALILAEAAGYINIAQLLKRD